MYQNSNRNKTAMQGRRQAASLPAQLASSDLQITLSFLKRRFEDYTVDQILFSLTQHVHNLQRNDLQNLAPQQQLREQQIQQPNMRNYPQENQIPILPQRTRITHYNRDARELRENIPAVGMSNEEKQWKYEEIRLVAMLFRETGVNFSLVRNFFPDMTPQRYRAYLDTINNQTINEIQKFLRYQCNIQIQHLSTDQKRSLKSQLLKVRQWLGQKHFSELQTYFKFILRHYQQKHVQICYDQSLRLYKRLLQIVKSPFIDVLEVINEQDQAQIHPTQRRINQRECSIPVAGFTKHQQTEVVQTYLKYNQIARANRELCQKYGMSQKWTKSSIKSLLRYVLKKSLKKIVISKEKYLKNGTPIMFKDYNQILKKLENNKALAAIKNKLLKFYICNKITVTGLTNMINSLNQLIPSRESSFNEVSLISDHQDSLSQIPKLQATLKREQRSQPGLSLPHLTQTQEPQVKEEIQRNGRDNFAIDEESDKLTEATNQERQDIKEQALAKGITVQYTQIIEID